MRESHGKGSFAEIMEAEGARKARSTTEAAKAAGRNAKAVREAREFHQKHMPSLPEPFVLGAWSAEKVLSGGQPDPAKVRERVERRLARIVEFERSEKAA